MKNEIRKFLNKNKSYLVIYVCFFILAYIIDAYYWGIVIEWVTNSSLTVNSLIIRLALLFTVIIVSKSIYLLIYNKLVNLSFQERMYKSVEFNEKVLDLPYYVFENNDYQSLIDRGDDFLTSDISGFQGALVNFIEGLPLIIIFIYSFIIISYYSFSLAIIGILTQFIIYPIRKKINEFDIENDLEKGNISNKLRYYKNFSFDKSYGKDIRVFNLKPIILDKYFILLDDTLKIVQSKVKLKIYLSFIYSIFVLISDILVFYLLFKYYQQNVLSMANILIVFNFYQLIIYSVQKLIEISLDIIKESSLFETYNQVINGALFKDLEVKDNESIFSKSDSDNFLIEFKNVTFKYPNTDIEVLSNLTFSFNSQDKIGIIGENGAGKTSLIKILIGLYEPTEGHIFFDGERANAQERKRFFSAIFQDSDVFSETIKENIFGGKEITFKEEKEALDKLTFFDISNFNLSMNLTKRFDKEGFELSGGQKQKILFLRSIMQDKDIIILDEPTASLDAKSEAVLYTQLIDSSYNKGFIIISHRLSISNIVDKIIILKNGLIHNFGSHEDLLKKDDLYKELLFTTKSLYKVEG